MNILKHLDSYSGPRLRIRPPLAKPETCRPSYPLPNNPVSPRAFPNGGLDALLTGLLPMPRTRLSNEAKSKETRQPQSLIRTHTDSHTTSPSGAGGTPH